MAEVTDILTSCKSLADAITYVSKRVKLVKTHTELPTPMDSDPDFGEYYNKAAVLDSGDKIRAVGAQMMDEVVRKAAPLAHQIYFCSDKVIKEVAKFMSSNNNVKALNGHYKKFIDTMEDVTPEMITTYVNAVKDFRQLPTLKVSGAEVITEAVTKNLKIASASFSLLEVMISDIIEKRNIRLGKGEGSKITKNPDAGKHAYDTYSAIMASDSDSPPILDHPVKQTNKKGDYLLATAFKKVNGQNLDAYIGKIKMIDNQLAKDVKTQIESMVEQTVQFSDQQKSPFVQQQMNIDPLFLTYFLTFSVLKLTSADFRPFQRIIYGAGRKTTGKAKINTYLNEYKQVKGIPELINNLSTVEDINLPPWMMNAHRMQEMFAVYGFGDSRDIDRTIKKPAASWRYINGMKSPWSVAAITVLFSIELHAINKENKVLVNVPVQAEHLFHQLLMQRRSPYQCTNWITGNVFSINISPAESVTAGVGDAVAKNLDGVAKDIKDKKKAEE